MLKVILILFTLSFYGCFNKDESVVTEFYKDIAVDKKFTEALNLLSKSSQSKMEPDMNDQIQFMNDLVSIKKFKSLYEYQAKRFEIKIDGVEEVGGNAKVVTVTYKKVNLSNNLMKLYKKKSEELKTEVAEQILTDSFVADFVASQKGDEMFFNNITQKVLIIKEDGKWVIDTKNVEMFFRSLEITRDLERHSYFEVTDLQAARDNKQPNK